MSNQNPEPARSLGNTIGLFLSLIAGVVWVVYGLSHAPHWLLIVGIVYTMLVGGYWAFGRELVDGRRERD
jgi:hypothetical protein